MKEEKVKKTKIKKEKVKKEKVKKVRGVAKKKALSNMIFNKNFLKLIIVPAALLVFAFFAVSFISDQIVGFISTLQLPSQFIAFLGLITSAINAFVKALIIFVFIRFIVAKTFEDGVKRPTKLTKSIGSYSVMALITFGIFTLAGFIGSIAYGLLSGLYLTGIFLASASMTLTISWIILIAFVNLMFDFAVFVLCISVVATLASAFISNDNKLKGTFANYGVITCGRNIKTLLQPVRFAHWIVLAVLVIPIYMGMTTPLIGNLTATITDPVTAGIAFNVLFGLIFFVAIVWMLTIFVYVVASIGYYVLVPAPAQKVVVKKEMIAKIKEAEAKEALVEKQHEEVEFQKALEKTTDNEELVTDETVNVNEDQINQKEVESEASTKETEVVESEVTVEDDSKKETN